MCFDHTTSILSCTIFNFFLAVWKLIVTTYLSFCTLQFGSFKPSQSNFKAEASSFVSLNSSSVSHWLVLRTAASAPQEAGEIRHRYNLQRTEEWPHYLIHALPQNKRNWQKNYMNTDNKFSCSVTSMSVRYSLAVLILHTEASFRNLPGYSSQIPNLSDIGWFQILRRGPCHKKLWGGRKSVCVEKKAFQRRK